MTSHVDPKVAAAVLAKDLGWNVSTRVDGTRVHYISAADTARLVRSALSIAFPGSKFSVRSKSYSGGSSVHVDWTDGPADSKVGDALAGFVGAGFDGMIDLAYSTDCYMTRAGTVGFAHTAGTAGSRGSVPAADAPVPAGAAIVHFGSYISRTRDYSGPVPDYGDYWAWHALRATDL